MNHTQTPKQKKLNWELIVAVLSLIVTICAGVPSVYEFAEKRGLFPQNQARPNQIQEKTPFIF